jgi:hypothetical protein
MMDFEDIREACSQIVEWKTIRINPNSVLKNAESNKSFGFSNLLLINLGLTMK